MCYAEMSKYWLTGYPISQTSMFLRNILMKRRSSVLRRNLSFLFAACISRTKHWLLHTHQAINASASVRFPSQLAYHWRKFCACLEGGWRRCWCYYSSKKKNIVRTADHIFPQPRAFSDIIRCIVTAINGVVFFSHSCRSSIRYCVRATLHVIIILLRRISWLKLTLV